MTIPNPTPSDLRAIGDELRAVEREMQPDHWGAIRGGLGVDAPAILKPGSAAYTEWCRNEVDRLTRDNEVALSENGDLIESCKRLAREKQRAESCAWVWCAAFWLSGVSWFALIAVMRRWM